jgi:hypothetical protein
MEAHAEEEEETRQDSKHEDEEVTILKDATKGSDSEFELTPSS